MIIAIGHQRDVGKDVAAQIFATQFKVQNPSLDVRHVAFADPIYEICEKMYGWAGMKNKRFYDNNKELKEKILPSLGKSPRQILIDVGMNMRDTYERTWLDYTLSLKADLIFISDLRFPNEAQAIKDAGGFLIKVHRDLEHVTESGDPDNQLLSWTDWDMEIHNDGTLQEYAKKIRETVNEIPIR